jgi:hypothetical protein
MRLAKGALDEATAILRRWYEGAEKVEPANDAEKDATGG